MSYRIVMSVIVAGLWTAFASADVWYVSPDGSDNQSGSVQEPFATIQRALNEIENSDTIVLLPGVYTGAGNYDLAVSGLSLTIRSADPDDWETVAATVIDPQDAGGVFAFENALGIVIEGLTIRNAVREYVGTGPWHGAAIFCKNVGIHIRRCVFTNCYTAGEFVAGIGGALYFDNSQAVVSHSQFTGNKGSTGGAVVCDGGSVVQMDHCTIAGNTATFSGGGVSCEFDSELTIRNSIFWGNRLTEGPAGQGPQINVVTDSSLDIEFSVVEDGLDGVDVDGTSSVVTGDGMLDADPLFALFDIESSPLFWDVRLKSQFGRWDAVTQEWVTDAVTSPCVAGAAEDAEYAGEPWPNGRRANIGAFGNTEQASLFGNIADLNIDGRVDIADLAMLAAVWHGAPNDYEDFDGSGVVDLADLIVMAQHWFWTKPSL